MAVVRKPEKLDLEHHIPPTSLRRMRYLASQCFVSPVFTLWAHRNLYALLVMAEQSEALRVSARDPVALRHRALHLLHALATTSSSRDTEWRMEEEKEYARDLYARRGAALEVCRLARRAFGPYAQLHVSGSKVILVLSENSPQQVTVEEETRELSLAKLDENLRVLIYKKEELWRLDAQ